jgi:murein DD-endopeptidase MepM/ murein hydrolase activator NlpD
VIVQILPEVWAHYHHLQPGSIAVRVGERVTTGQLLGRVGNTGGSFAPHLHFQLADGLAFYNSNGLPYGFDRYTLVGTLAEDPSAPDQLRVEGTPHAQTSTYPLIDSVVDFR